MKTTDLRTFALAAVAAAVVAALLPVVLVDGDSCTNAAVARDMATGTWETWVAPQWAQGGAWTWFREHAPGSYWASALLQFLGLPAERAPLLANALWSVAAACGVAAIVRHFRPGPAAWIAGVVLLLHIPALKYVQRVSIEMPLAACTAWTLAGALRLRAGQRYIALTALALGGAFLVRGAFGGVAAALVVAVLLEPSTRPPLGRWFAAVVLAAVPVLAFDVLHAAVTGTSFWWAYFHRQVASSFVEGGTQHTGAERQFGYFTVRLVLYALPWAVLPLWRAARGPRWLPSAAAWRLCLVGVLVSLLGASATMRPASRYLFGAWPCLAALFGLTLPQTLPSWVGSRAAAVFVVLPAALIAGKALAGGDAEWTSAAETLRRLRIEGRAPAEVRGPFDPQDARDKAFLRWHLGTRAISGPAVPGVETWRLVRSEGAAGAHDTPVATTPFGTLHTR